MTQATDHLVNKTKVVVQVTLRDPDDGEYTATLFEDGEVRCTKGWIRFRYAEPFPDDWTVEQKASAIFETIAKYYGDKAREPEGEVKGDG